MNGRVKDPADLTDEALTCRDEGHSWQFVEDIVVENRGRVVEFTQVRLCPRCSTFRKRTIDGSAFTIKRTAYHYERDYALERGVRLSRLDWRRAAITRALRRRAV